LLSRGAGTCRVWIGTSDDRKKPFLETRGEWENLVGLPHFSAAFGTLFSWGVLPFPKGLEWIGNFDSYIGLGVLLIPVVDFDSIGGISYYFTNKVALNVEAGLKASYIGILCKL